MADPLDASPFFTDPCAVLTSAQQVELGISKTGTPDPDGDFGPSCLWNSDADNGAVSVTFNTDLQDGLSGMYRKRQQFEFFEEVTVAGYPAVFTGLIDERPSGICGLVVGISDELTFHALVQFEPGAENACNRAKQAGASVIETLKRGS